MGRIYHIVSLDRLEESINTVERTTYGVFICTAGEARLSLGGKVYKMEKDMLLIYTPYSTIRILEHSSDWDGMMLEEDMDLLFTTLSGIPVRKRLSIREHPCIRLSDKRRNMLMQLVDAISHRDTMLDGCSDDSRAALLREVVLTLAKAVCLEIIDAYFDCAPVGDIPQSREARVYDQFIASAFENCLSHRTVAYYAAEQNLSPGHFSVVIREVSGRTAMKWIESIAMAKARKLLGDMSLSIKEIAQMMNFPDQSAFGRYFKSREGVPPSVYRKRLAL